ncbi:MAG: OmpA family protein, partial [Pyrinomonadaceae bacterium]
MSKPHAPPGILDEAAPSEDGHAPPPPDGAEMAELRSLLLGPAERQIAEIHARLTDPQRQIEEVSRVLPEAIDVRTRRDDEVAAALQPTVERAINISVRRDPKALVDAIFPVMGPAIRRAIAAALSGMVQSFNRTLEYSLSVRGLKWRFEALRTGRSFAEVILLHTLRYRVEQVFLIHRETGLLLQHVSAGAGGGGAAVQDADMVSGMLTAIQDFVHDSFSTAQGDQLETLQVGELTVWVEQGPLALLAGVIRGNAPQELRQVFQSTLEKIHLRFNPHLKDFEGDAAVFEPARPLLEDCLEAQYDAGVQAGAKRNIWLSPASLALSVVVAALLVWVVLHWRDARRWDAYLQRLKAEPGLVVTDAGVRAGKYFVGGLRDPLAADPETLLAEAKLERGDVVGRWQPYQALTGEFVAARARKLLQPPDTIDLKVEGGVLQAVGTASHEWIVETRRAVRFMPGLSEFREDRLFDTDVIEKQFLLFELDRSQLVPGQGEKLNNLVAEFEKVSALARSMGRRVRVEITGRT